MRACAAQLYSITMHAQALWAGLSLFTFCPAGPLGLPPIHATVPISYRPLANYIIRSNLIIQKSKIHLSMYESLTEGQTAPLIELRPHHLEFLRSAFADGENGAYRCLLNPTYGHHGSPTFRARGQTSIVDFIITSHESMHRVHNVHVENGTQARGAIGIGSDHNLLYVDWKLQIDMPECSNTVRQTWNITELEDPANQKAYQKAFQATLRSNFAASHADCPHALEILNSAHPDINTMARQQAAQDIYYHTFVGRG
jgi:hypothetical protein